MKELKDYIKENIISEWSPIPAVAARNALNKSFLFGKTGSSSSKTDTVKYVRHILDVMYEMAENKEKVFGIKYDEICGNLAGHLWYHCRTLADLENGKYIKKYGNIYNVLLTTTTKENTIPCEESVPIYELTIPNYKTMQSVSDDKIKEAVIKASERLKRTVKLY